MLVQSCMERTHKFMHVCALHVVCMIFPPPLMRCMHACTYMHEHVHTWTYRQYMCNSEACKLPNTESTFLSRHKRHNFIFVNTSWHQNDVVIWSRSKPSHLIWSAVPNTLDLIIIRTNPCMFFDHSNVYTTSMKQHEHGNYQESVYDARIKQRSR